MESSAPQALRKQAIRKEKILLYTLAFINFTHIMDFMIVMPLGNILMEEFSISAYEFSLIVSSYTISAGVASFLGAFFLDRSNKKALLTGVYIGFVVGTIACAWAPTYAILLLARSLTGMFGGLISALVLSMVSDAIPYARRGMAMGVVMAAFSLASVFGVPFGLLLADLYSWHAPFYFLGVASSIACAFLFFFVPKPKVNLANTQIPFDPVGVIKRLMADKNQLWALLLSVLLIFGQFMVIPFITPYLLRNVGMEQDMIKYIYLLGGGLTIFSSPYFGKISDRFGKFRVFSILAFGMTVPLIALTHLPVVPVYVVLIVTSVFFITGSGRMAPVQAIVTSAVSPESRGSFMGFKSSVQQLSSGLAAFIAGIMVVETESGELQGYNMAGYAAAICSIIAVFIAKTIKVAPGNA